MTIDIYLDSITERFVTDRHQVPSVPRLDAIAGRIR